MAMVFQNYALYPHMTVRDNIAFPLKMQKIPKTEVDARVSEATRLLGLDELLRRKPRELRWPAPARRDGSGNRPASAGIPDGRAALELDAKLRVQTCRARQPAPPPRRDDLVRDPRPDGGDDARRASRVLRMGVIQQVDAPQRLYHRPANTFVAGFIGSPPMNFVPGTLADGVLDVGAFRFELPESVRGRLRTKEGAVMAGLRPEHFQDAGLAHAMARRCPTSRSPSSSGPKSCTSDPRARGGRDRRAADRLAGAFAARLDLRSDAAPGRSSTWPSTSRTCSCSTRER